jgi:hypothetical protein
MAFHIRVYRLSDHPWVHHPPPALLADPDRLSAEGLARALYDNPLGSGHTVAVHWSSPAATLGLPLLAALYEQGLEAAGSALLVLERELEVLERAWQPLSQQTERDVVEFAWDSPGAPPTRRALTLHEHLLERAGFLREALRIAREQGGFVSIG